MFKYSNIQVKSLIQISLFLKFMYLNHHSIVPKSSKLAFSHSIFSSELKSEIVMNTKVVLIEMGESTKNLSN